MKSESLYIPQGLKTRREYFNGFGNRELRYLLVSIIMTGGGSFLGYQLFLNLFQAMLIFMIVPTAVCFLSVKTEMNVSVIEECILLIRFQRSQKYYPYVSLNEWEK